MGNSSSIQIANGVYYLDSTPQDIQRAIVLHTLRKRWTMISYLSKPHDGSFTTIAL